MASSCVCDWREQQEGATCNFAEARQRQGQVRKECAQGHREIRAIGKTIGGFLHFPKGQSDPEAPKAPKAGAIEESKCKVAGSKVRRNRMHCFVSTRGNKGYDCIQESLHCD